MPTNIFNDITNSPRELFPFETIKFSGKVEILDREGHVARFRRRQRIRFLEDGVTTFFDRVWGEGVLFANYHAKAMRLIDAIPTRKGYVVVLALPRPFKKGEVFEVETQRRIVGAFIYDWGYWDSTMAVPTERLQIDVLTPSGLNTRRPEIIAPAYGDFDASKTRGRLQLRVRHPAPSVPYRLRWDW